MESARASERVARAINVGVYKFYIKTDISRRLARRFRGSARLGEREPCGRRTRAWKRAGTFSRNFLEIFSTFLLEKRRDTPARSRVRDPRSLRMRGRMVHFDAACVYSMRFKYESSGSP